MTTIQLPKYPYCIQAVEINYVSTVNPSESYNGFISPSLRSYLNACKQDIGTELSNWDLFKRYTNPYEYVHTLVPGCRNAVCREHPISRAYFKLYEIIKDHNLLSYPSNIPIRTFHLAEGPGGFVEATVEIRNSAGGHPTDAFHGITLIDSSNDSIPGWNKIAGFMQKHPQFSIEKGSSGTGDLLDCENLRHCFEKYGNTMDFITGDGGFDFSTDYNGQENQSLCLLLAQVAFALSLQKRGGNFVVKVFDMFTRLSVEILFLLNSVYGEVIIQKPLTSRFANSERYIVCKDYQITDSRSYAHMFYLLLKNIAETNGSLPLPLLRFDIPRFFVDKVEEVNATFGQQQIENIKNTLSLIRNHDDEKLETLKKNGVHRCVAYCQKYGLNHGKQQNQGNIFLSKFPSTIYDEQST